MWRLGIVLLLLMPVFSWASLKLTQQEYQQLKKAYDLIEANQTQAAKTHLLSASKKMQSAYAKALVWQNLGQLELKRDHHLAALGYLQKAYAQHALPAPQQNNLQKTIAQLHCMAEQWAACSRELSRWIKKAGKTHVKGNDYLLLAQAYSQQNQWRAALPAIRSAIATRNVAPRHWYQLEAGAYIRLKKWNGAVKAQQRLVRHYPNKSADWRQLTSLQLQAGQMASALATQRMGVERGWLTKARDYRQLAQLLIQQGAPYQAGQALEKGLKKGVLKANAPTLKLLSQSWQRAKDKHKAIHALQQLHAIAPSSAHLQRIAQLQIELETWQSAQRTLLMALKSAQGRDYANVQLLLGIVDIKLEQFALARQALEEALKYPVVSHRAKSWLSYLQQIAPDAQLAVAG